MIAVRAAGGLSILSLYCCRGPASSLIANVDVLVRSLGRQMQKQLHVRYHCIHFHYIHVRQPFASSSQRHFAKPQDSYAELQRNCKTFKGSGRAAGSSYDSHSLEGFRAARHGLACEQRLLVRPTFFGLNRAGHIGIAGSADRRGHHLRLLRNAAILLATL